MPTIAFASSKGGCGKSTASVLLACELARRGASVTLVDADPNQPVARWGSLSGRPDKLAVIGGITEETLLDTVDAAATRTAFVIIDLEGSASLMIAQAMSRSDLVIIPVKGSVLDGNEAIKAIRFLQRQERAYHRAIPYRVLISQTNPAVRPRTLKALESELLEQQVPMFGTALNDRDAYRAVFAFGGTIYDLDPAKVGGLAGAVQNVRALTSEVVSTLKMAAEAA